MSPTQSRAGLFCKTFRSDFDHLQILLDSFERHNPEKLIMTVSLPESDIDAFWRSFGRFRENIKIVVDESYTGSDLKDLRGWHAQQLCKLESASVVEADHYAVVDSDCYFIRNITGSDLMPRAGTRYMACGSLLRTVVTSENRDLIAYLNDELSINSAWFPDSELGERTQDLSSYLRFKDLNLDNPSALQRSDIPFRAFGARKWYFYQPGQIFSRNLLQEMKRFLRGEGISLRDAILISPWEYNWYGEFASFAFRESTDFKISPFIHFADDESLILCKENNITTEKIARKFILVAMAARHLQRLSLDF